MGRNDEGIEELEKEVDHSSANRPDSLRKCSDKNERLASVQFLNRKREIGKNIIKNSL